MSETIRDGKLGYVHGHNEILSPSVHKELEGRSADDVIEVPIDGNQIFGPRDESLVFTDHIENVPEEYRQVGSSILMENDRGQTRSFLVTWMDDEKLTVDGNNPLCGREVVFTLEILTVRDATDEETRAGQAINAGADIDPALLRPV
jgi:FKBP-type peptidyl-prolyl cis-trans isomerase SlyD